LTSKQSTQILVLLLVDYNFEHSSRYKTPDNSVVVLSFNYFVCRVFLI